MNDQINKTRLNLKPEIISSTKIGDGKFDGKK